MMEMSISDAFAQAIRHYRSGNLEGAEKICKTILQASQHDKEVFEALRMLGAILHRQKRYEEAKVHLEKAIVLEPNNPELYNNLSEISHKLGKPLEAEKAARQAISILPNYAGAENNLGNALKQQNRLDEAADAYHRSLEICPNDANFQSNLGDVFRDQGMFDEAVIAYRKVLAIQPNHVKSLNHLGLTLNVKGRLQEAETTFRRLLAVQPDSAGVWNNLGNTLQVQGRFVEAEEAFRRALAIDPNYAVAECSLGLALCKKGLLTEAMLAFQRALDIDPESADAENDLGLALLGQGLIREAKEAFRRSLEIQPDAKVHSSLLLCLNYDDSIDPETLFSEHLQWEELFGRVEAPHPHDNDPSPERRLRIGYVSPDFRTHAVAFFVEPILAHHGSENVETFCYSECLVSDTTTKRFQSMANAWRSIHGLKDDQVARMIREDAIDILVDLAGHTANNRLGVFGLKPAPIQITWLGYVGTTGLSAMDYLLADRFLVPEEKENYYREKVLRLPDCYLCFEPPTNAPEVVPLPVRTKGYFTFGCFNTLAKINHEVIALWSEILLRLPDAQLILKFKGFEEESTRCRYKDSFAKYGVDPTKLDLQGWSPRSELLDHYNQIDLALDPFPYSGGTTTCEAMWMGVPIVICPGETFASRVSLSFLSSVGLTDTIAKDLSDYVDLTVKLANDLPRLAKLRAGLRERMARSPLCDGKRFAESLMKALRGVWREWCRGTPN